LELSRTSHSYKVSCGWNIGKVQLPFGLTFYYLVNASPLAFRHLGLTRVSTSLLCWEYYFFFSL